MTSDPSQTEHRSPRSNAAPNGTSAPSSEAGPTAQAPPAAPVVNTKPAASWTERFHVMQGVLPIDPSRVSIEVVAGVTLAALAIPEVMGYTAISGTPVVTGLYTILLPIAVFALLGSSRHLVVGADSATAAILAAGLVVLATPQSPSYVALAAAAALMTAGWLILARIIGLAFLADFLSRSVLVGFLTGVGIQVAAGQIAGMLGVPGGGSGTIDKALTALSQLPQANLPTLIVSASVLVVIVGLRLVARQIPGALIAVVGSIVASYVFDLAAIGVKPLGPVPGGLPTIGLPDVALSSLPPLLPTTFAMFVVILAQSAATSRAYAARYEERHDENTDLVGLSLANVAAGITGTFVVNGSPTKTQMVDSAGGRSQVAQLTTGVIVIAVLLFLTGPLAYMPNAVLASVVFIIGLKLVDIRGMLDIYRLRFGEFIVALITAATVVVIGVEQGIIVAMALSVIEHISHSYRPFDNLLAWDKDGSRAFQPLATNSQAEPGLAIYAFGASLYYANSARFTEELMALVEDADPPLRWLAISCSAIGDVDYSGADAISKLVDELSGKGITLSLCDVSPQLRKLLDAYELTNKIGADRIFDTAKDLSAAFKTA